MNIQCWFLLGLTGLISCSSRDFQESSLIPQFKRINAFGLWSWIKLLRVPWTARRSNQSLKEISPGCSKAESPILWPADVKSWLIWKDPDAGRDWGQEEKGTSEDEMVGWHHWLDGHGFGWTLGVGDGQRGLACCSSWGSKELDMTEWLNWTELNKSLAKAYKVRNVHRNDV